MCAPKTPKVEKIPTRAAMILPDGGDPRARQGAKGRQRLSTSAMIFSKQGTLGAPSVSGPIGTSGM
jgi:hypothetical protein